jgi:hypothetical protein
MLRGEITIMLLQSFGQTFMESAQRSNLMILGFISTAIKDAGECGWPFTSTDEVSFHLCYSLRSVYK